MFVGCIDDVFLGEIFVHFSSVAQSCSTLCDLMDCSMPGLPVASSTPRAYSNSSPSCWWGHPTISSSVIPFSFLCQSFQASGSLTVSQFFASGGQSTEISALTSVLQMVIQDWFPLGLKLLAVQGTLRSLLQHHNSKVSTLWRSAFFIAQLSHTYVTTRKTVVLTRRTFVGKVMSLLFNMLSRLVIAFLTRGKHLFFFFFFNFMVQSPWCNLQWFWSPQK